MKKMRKIGLEILLSGSLALGFLNTNSESFADEHTEYIDSKRDSNSNFGSKKAQLKKIVESNVSIDINQDLEYDAEIASVWDKKKNCYAPLDDIYGIYLIVKNPEAKVVYTIKLGGFSKSAEKEKYDIFHHNNFAISANSKIISHNGDALSWELSPTEGGRLVFGRLIEKKWPLLDKKTIEVSGEWYFNAGGDEAQYINAGNKDEPLPSDYPLGPVKINIQR